MRLVRGRPRSTSLRDALAAARAALARGCGEIVLSGIDLGAWRDGELRLPDLVLALAELPGLARLRLSSLEPRHLDERLLEALAHPRVARHLHVPLQSADDAVLAAMRRPYTFAQYASAAARMQARLGDCMLSTDVIVGFPAEDDAAFGRTLAALESGLFGRVHVFAYSPRPGTAAAELPPLPAAARQGTHGARAGGRRRRPPGPRAVPRWDAPPRSSSRSGARGSGGGTVQSTSATTSRVRRARGRWSAPWPAKNTRME